jgi:ATP adenylyltransferase
VFAHRNHHRCECCGAHEHQRALEVDPIIPMNQGGTGDISNLQALCFRVSYALASDSPANW